MVDIGPRRHAFRLLVCLTSLAMSGCSTVMNPYLPLKTAPNAPACAGSQTCAPVDRFKEIRDGVAATQDQARKSYTDRALINSWTSALAFPLTGALLYGGATRGSEGARKGILGWGLALGAGYEARNALLAGSPESAYILAEARLACVVDEAGKYNLKAPDASCGQKQTDLVSQIDRVQGLKPSAEMSVKRDAYVTRATGALTAYAQRDQTISDAADHMQAAARKIVVDTNFQIKTASISPSVATALLRSDLAIIQPGSKLDDSKAGPTGSGTSDQEMAMELNKLVDRLSAFAQACVMPQPSSPAAFDGCTTYSPAVPPLPTLTTSLPGKEFSMSPGGTTSFTVTSQPSGTPWADFSGDVSVAMAALGRPQIVTLTPTQSQVTLTYANAVEKESTVVLNITTLGVAGNALPLTITLKPKPGAQPQPPVPPVPAAPAVAVAAAAGDPKLAALKTDPCLMQILKLDASATEADLRARLETQWRAYGNVNPAVDAITATAFVAKIKADQSLNTGNCK